MIPKKLAGMLEKMNYTETTDYKEADIIIYNTCCVRENAEEKLLEKIGEVKKQREEKRNYTCNMWLYDARTTYKLKKNKKELSIYRYYFWNTHIT